MSDTLDRNYTIAIGDSQATAEKLFGVIPERLKAAREARGLAQAEVGRRLHIGQGTVSELEHATSKTSLIMLYRLASLYEVSLDWLCGRENAHPRVQGGERVTNEQLTRQLALTRATLMGLIQALEDQGAIMPPPNLEERMGQHWDQAAQQLGIPDDGTDVDLTALWPPRMRP